MDSAPPGVIDQPGSCSDTWSPAASVTVQRSVYPELSGSSKNSPQSSPVSGLILVPASGTEIMADHSAEALLWVTSNVATLATKAIRANQTSNFPRLPLRVCASPGFTAARGHTEKFKREKSEKSEGK